MARRSLSHQAIPLMTSLPTGPVDGQVIYYAADATNSVIWNLRYNAASASAYKWEFIGGGPLIVTSTATFTLGTAAWTVVSGMSITLPLAGEYEVNFGAGFLGSNGAAGAAFDVVAAVWIASAQSAMNAQATVASGATFSGAGASITERRTATAGQVAQLQWWLNAAQPARMICPFMSIRPVRVS